MIGEALEVLRQRAEAGKRYAAGVIDTLRGRVAALILQDGLPPIMAMQLAAAFTNARLDVGDAVRAAMGMQMERAAPAEGEQLFLMADNDPAAVFAEVTKAFGDNPFLIHNELASMFNAMPAEQRIMLATALAATPQPALRAATLGWLLNSDAAVRRAVANALAEAGAHGLVSQASQARLLLLRNWLPEAERDAIDAAIRAANGKTAADAPQPAVLIRTLLMSGRDGAGAQTIFGLIKRGRQHGFVSILVKQGFGVCDTVVQADLTRDDAEQLTMMIEDEMITYETSLESAVKLISHALCENRATAVPPPFGLVQCVELLGLTGLSPQPYPSEALVADLLAGIDLPSRAVTQALQASKRWHVEEGFADSWFDTNDETTALLASVRGKAKRIEAVLERGLPARRAYCGDILAWTAFAMHEDEEDDAWIDMALVAREWLGSRPLAEISLARMIATATVEAIA